MIRYFNFSILQEYNTPSLKDFKRIYALENIKVMEYIEVGVLSSVEIKMYVSAEMRIIMFKLWAKMHNQNKMIKDIVICNDNKDISRTQMIFDAMNDVCYEFDLSKPIWLALNIEEFKKRSKTRFRQDNFIDAVEFDYLEIEVIKELD